MLWGKRFWIDNKYKNFTIKTKYVDWFFSKIKFLFARDYPNRNSVIFTNTIYSD